jgi:hypothetical protein
MQASNLKTHISRHLEQVALFAVPPANMMQNLDSDITGSGLSRRNVNGSRAGHSQSRALDELPQFPEEGSGSDDDSERTKIDDMGKDQTIYWTNP